MDCIPVWATGCAGALPACNGTCDGINDISCMCCVAMSDEIRGDERLLLDEFREECIPYK
jgi:hypothetical protein